MYPRQILIVDDDVQARMLVVNLVMKRWPETEVLTAINGEQGLEIAMNEIPEIILLDWEMPEMNGLEVLTKLRKEMKTRHIPVIMHTGVMTETGDLEVALEHGANEFLRKPIDPAELAARIKSLVTIDRLTRQKLASEKAQTEMELGRIADDLALIAALLEGKDTFLEELSTELKTVSLANLPGKEGTKIRQSLMKIEAELNSSAETQLISDRMDLVSKGFISEIRNKHNDLSKGDLRLCTLMKLNLSVKEIAQTLHVSHSAIEKRRYRLKKKMGLDADSSLDEYVLGF